MHLIIKAILKPNMSPCMLLIMKPVLNLLMNPIMIPIFYPIVMGLDFWGMTVPDKSVWFGILGQQSRVGV